MLPQVASVGEKSSTGSRRDPATPPARSCCAVEPAGKGWRGGRWACRARRVRGCEWKLSFTLCNVDFTLRELDDPVGSSGISSKPRPPPPCTPYRPTPLVILGSASPTSYPLTPGSRRPSASSLASIRRSWQLG